MLAKKGGRNFPERGGMRLVTGVKRACESGVTFTSCSCLSTSTFFNSHVLFAVKLLHHAVTTTMGRPESPLDDMSDPKSPSLERRDSAATHKEDTQVTVLITPYLPDQQDSFDDDDTLLQASPTLSLQRLRIPKEDLATILPEGQWFPSPVSALLGVPIKLARWHGSDSNKTSNPAIVGFTMLCDFADFREFGKVTMPKITGAVMFAKVDGSELDVDELRGMIAYLVEIGHDFRIIKEAVDIEARERDHARHAEGLGGDPDLEARAERRAKEAELRAASRAPKAKAVAERKVSPEAFAAYCKAYKAEMASREGEVVEV
jgi:hypothetical protein